MVFSCCCLELRFWWPIFHQIKYHVSRSQSSIWHSVYPAKLLNYLIYTPSNISTWNKPVRSASLLMLHNKKWYVSRPAADRNDTLHIKHDFKWSCWRRKHNNVHRNVIWATTSRGRYISSGEQTNTSQWNLPVNILSHTYMIICKYQFHYL